MNKTLKIIIILGVIIAALAIGVKYYTACREAKIWNKLEYPDYTCGDFFLARNLILQLK